MTRPKIFDYDPASEETIVTAGVQGAMITWIGIRPNTLLNGKEPTIHMLFSQGTIGVGGDSIEVETKPVVQVTLEGQGFTDFYIANKTLLDDLHRACLEYIADKFGKTGQVIET